MIINPSTNQPFNQPQMNFEGGDPFNSFKQRKFTGNSVNVDIRSVQRQLVRRSRWLQRNIPVANGILRHIASRVAPVDAGLRPVVKRKDGTLHKEVNRLLLKEYTSWLQNCDISGRLGGPKLYNLTSILRCRDGEVFIRFLEGGDLDHNGAIPLSISLINTDACPIHFTDASKNIHQGIEVNDYLKPINYLFRRKADNIYGNNHHLSGRPESIKDYVIVPSKDIIHYSNMIDVNELRGVPIFHSVIKKLLDIDDYEAYIQTAAKLSSAIMFQIIRDSSYIRPTTSPIMRSQESGDRRYKQWAPGIFYDKLEPGEMVKPIETSSQPITGAEAMFDHILKMVSIGASVPSTVTTKKYDGSYTAQRMQMIDDKMLSSFNSSDYSETVIRRLYNRWLECKIVYDGVSFLSGVDTNTIYDIAFKPPRVPYIDTQKEMTAYKIARELGITSRTGIISNNNEDPNDVFEEIKEENEIFGDLNYEN